MDVQLEVRAPEKAERVDEDVRALDRDHRADEADLPDGPRLALDPAEGRRIEPVRKRDDAVGVDREVEHPFPMERGRRDEHVRQVQDVGEVPVELGERLAARAGRASRARCGGAARSRKMPGQIAPRQWKQMLRSTSLADLELLLDPLPRGQTVQKSCSVITSGRPPALIVSTIVVERPER